LKNKPAEFIVQVAAQLVEGAPANIPHALVSEFIAELILNRSQ
jgi:hypothetical protein